MFLMRQKRLPENLTKKKYAEQKGPIEPATKDDIQFVQAMNVLKGLPVQKTPETKTDTVKTN